MKVAIQKDLFKRSQEVFERAAHAHNIHFILIDILDEAAMLSLHEQNVNCFVIGAESYSHQFYQSLKPGSAVIRYGVGYNAVPIDICIERNIQAAYTPDTLTDSVAEHTFALLLALNRHISTLDNSFKGGEWQGIIGNELKGKTLAVIGYGQIGKAVARIAYYGFGMIVKVYSSQKSINDEFVEYFSNNFKSVVQDADIISLHLASVPDTKDFINKETIRLLKHGAQLINTSRGDLINEKDLYDALESKKVSSAALDVYLNEPYIPTKNADFKNLDNIILTPHCGSNTIEANNRMANLVIKNIIFYFENKEMILIPELNKK